MSLRSDPVMQLAGVCCLISGYLVRKSEVDMIVKQFKISDNLQVEVCTRNYGK
jgi:hypothetical protein